MRNRRKKERGLTLSVGATVACLVAIVVLLGFYTTYGNYVKNVRALHFKEVAIDVAESKMAMMKGNSSEWYQPKTEDITETRERIEYRIKAESQDTSRPEFQTLSVQVSWNEQNRQREVEVLEEWSCERPPNP